MLTLDNLKIKSLDGLLGEIILIIELRIKLTTISLSLRTTYNLLKKYPTIEKIN